LVVVVFAGVAYWSILDALHRDSVETGARKRSGVVPGAIAPASAQIVQTSVRAAKAGTNGRIYRRACTKRIRKTPAKGAM
jgi:hypothetical protein